MPRTPTDEVLVGHVNVDSGQIMIGDPCYVLPQRAWNRPGRTYDELLENTSPSGTEQTREPFGRGVALVTSSGYGDGQYPVYITRTRDGAVRSITVYFDDSPEDRTCQGCGTVFDASGQIDFQGLCSTCAWAQRDEEREDTDAD
jgi:hypothetical protein